MLRTRLMVGTLLIAALVALCWLDHGAGVPGAWLLPVLVAFTILASQELLKLFAAKGLRPVAASVYAGNLLVVLSPWAGSAARGLESSAASAIGDSIAPGSAAEFVLAALAIAVALALLGEMARYGGPGRVAENLGASVFAVVYLGLLLSFAVRLRLEQGVAALASLLIVVKMGDTGAYFCGKVFGAHRMSPRLSPSKTVEGAIGAIVFSAAASWAVFQWLVPLASLPGRVAHGPGSSLAAIGFGVVLGVVGIVGDLAESLLKRDAACKDSSSWVPGLGGVLDMLDSILLAAPVAFACWRLGWIG